MTKSQKKDLKCHTLEELLTQNYGKKGTKKRLIADKKIIEAQCKLVKNLKKLTIKNKLK